MSMKTTVRVSADVEYDHAVALKVIAAEEGRSLAALVRLTLIALIHEREELAHDGRKPVRRDH